jgi:hypothetical protein
MSREIRDTWFWLSVAVLAILVVMLLYPLIMVLSGSLAAA